MRKTILMMLVAMAAVLSLAGCQQDVVFPTPLPTSTPAPTATPALTATPDARIEEVQGAIDNVALDIRQTEVQSRENLRNLAVSIDEDLDDLEKRLLSQDVISQSVVDEICDLRFRAFALAHTTAWLAVFDTDEAEYWLYETYRDLYVDYEYNSTFPICTRQNGVWRLP